MAIFLLVTEGVVRVKGSIVASGSAILLDITVELVIVKGLTLFLIILLFELALSVILRRDLFLDDRIFKVFKFTLTRVVLLSF